MCLKSENSGWEAEEIFRTQTFYSIVTTVEAANQEQEAEDFVKESLVKESRAGRQRDAQ